MTISPYEKDLERIVAAIRHVRAIDVNVLPPSDSQGLHIEQAGSGSNGGASTGQNGFGFAYDLIYIRDQRADTGTSPQTYGLHIFYDIGGGLSQGSKYALRVDAVKQAPQNPAVASQDMIAAAFVSLANVNDGGTNTGAGARGTIFGASPGAVLSSGATNYEIVSGGEVDVAIQTGASSKWRFGWSVIGTGNLQAAALDAAVEIGAIGTDPGWKTGLLFASIHGAAPVGTAGTLIGTDGTAATVTHGIDWSAYTFSTDIFKGPHTRIDNNGNIFISGIAFPFVTLAPTGATTVASFNQLGDVLQLSDHNVANFLSINLLTGAVDIAATLRTVATIVGSLPAAATAGAGARSFVTDANATTFASIVATGGANGVPVYSDGTNWRIG